jgi:hypothetical protein
MRFRIGHSLEEHDFKSIIGAKKKKKKSVLGKLFNKAFAPFIKKLDGIDADYSDRPNTRKALIALLQLRVPICILLIAAVMISGTYFVVDSYNSASTEMSLNYEEGAYGLNPNSTRFYVYNIESPEVVERMLNYCGIDPNTVDINEIINCISVRPVNAKAFSEENLFITTTYKISMRKPSSIKGVSVGQLLTFLCRAYKDNFYENYTENRSILEFDIEELNDQEYMVIADLFDLKAQQIEKYLNTRSKQSKSFTEKESDETFKSLVKKVEDLRNYDVVKYRSFVKEAGCSHDKARYIRSLGYVNRMNTIDYSKNMAAYTVNNEGIKMYNEAMANIVMIPSIDKDKNTYYMSRTKTGMDYMAKQADDNLISAQEIAKNVKYNNEVIKKMQEGKNESADIQKANKMIDDIKKKFSELSKQVETVDKAYVKYRTKDYLTFKSTNIALRQRLQPTKLAIIAVVLLVGIYALILIKFRFFAQGGTEE